MSFCRHCVEEAPVDEVLVPGRGRFELCATCADVVASTGALPAPPRSTGAVDGATRGRSPREIDRRRAAGRRW